MDCRLIVETPPSRLTGVLHVMHGFGCSAFDIQSDEDWHSVEPRPARLVVKAQARAELRRYLEQALGGILAGDGSVTVVETTAAQ